MENDLNTSKLLDYWEVPENAGEPIGCIATTFTFDSAFFEEDCLSRFLGMESSPEEDDGVYILEREEKLQSLKCVLALVDQHNCAGKRSLRWNLLPVRHKNGVLHSKISLLCWANKIRLIIASANLTEDGYRRNREVFGVLDYEHGSKTGFKPLYNIIEQLKSIMQNANGAGEEIEPIENASKLLEIVKEKIRKWQIKSDTEDSEVEVNAILTGFSNKSVFESIESYWPGNIPPYCACIISPFFDKYDRGEKYRPAEKLWEILRQKGEADIYYDVETQELEEKKKVLLKAPRLLQDTKPGRASCSIHFRQILNDNSSRPLHMKAIWLENDYNLGYMIGSSNFTSKGTGVDKTSNIEANLFYTARVSTKAYRELDSCYPEVEDITKVIEWGDTANNEDDATDELLVLPEAFRSAIFTNDKDGKKVVNISLSKKPPENWSIYYDDKLLYDDKQWASEGTPEIVAISWNEIAEPSGFQIRWKESNGYAWLPINVSSLSILQPPDDLKNLPLDVLISIIASSKPYFKIIKGYIKKKNRKKDPLDGPDVEIDPLKRVDTSTFLLQRTRKISKALLEMRKRLERPFSTIESLYWRLQGPVGVKALVSNIENSAKSEMEKTFLISEIVLELGRVRPAVDKNAVDKSIVAGEISKFIKELKSRVEIDKVKDPIFKEYIKSSFREAR